MNKTVIITRRQEKGADYHFVSYRIVGSKEPPEIEGWRLMRRGERFTCDGVYLKTH